MSGFTTELYADDPADRYIVAYNSMNVFEQSVVHVDTPSSSFPPIQGELEIYLTNLKATAWGWLNDAAPRVKELPISIVTLKSGIEPLIGDLEILKSSSHRIDSQVIQVTTLLLNQLTPQYESMTSLDADCCKIYSALSANFETLNSCISDLDKNIDQVSGELLRTLAQYQAAKSASSPDRGKIRNLEQQIQKLRDEIGGGDGWKSTLSPLRQNITDAKSSATYLAASWESFGAEVSHVIGVLRLIKMRPAALGEISLEHMRQSWAAIESYMSEIVRGLSGVRYGRPNAAAHD
jgi:hypothetical protein